ncbi:MAG: SoxR reducing system RseC family protein [Candidatus Brocadiae bacterium]|nr:SoxR reducing system RseC family protein [Candidatus Brocadiia bacterium]
MGNQQTKLGLVVKVEENRISIQIISPSSGECGTSCRCKALAMVEESKGPRIWVKGDYRQRFKPNDFVMVEANLPSPYIGIFFLFILPILGLFFGSFLGHALSIKHSLLDPQSLSILGAVASFAMIMGIAMLVDYKIRSKNETFRLEPIESLRPESHQECKNISRTLKNENK